MNERLDSWKDIATYLGRDVRTVQRWERTKNLPVRRLPGGDMPRIYALTAELDVWRDSRSFALRPEAQEAAQAAVPSVAVLPFLNLAGEEADQAFADGLADDIITALSRLPGLKVTARTSTFAFRGKDQDVRAIGRKLGVGAVLEGSFRRSGNRVRVTAQLIGADNGFHLWSERYDRDLTDAFAIQDEVTVAIVDALQVRLTGRSAGKRKQPNPEAYRLWLEGRYLTLRQPPVGIPGSRDRFTQAIALDPGFAPAYVGLAESWWEGAAYGLERPRDAVAAGRPAVESALEIDPELGEGHAMLGVYLGMHDFDWAAADRAFRRALELSPASPVIRMRYAAFHLEPTGRLDEAKAVLEEAVAFDPLSAAVHYYLGHDLMIRREFERSEAELKLAIGLDPGCWRAHLRLGGANISQGRFAEALELWDKLTGTIGPNDILLAARGILKAVLGDPAGVREIARQLAQARQTRYVSSISLAWVHFAMRDVESALDWLETAVEERDPLLAELHSKFIYDPLRSHPRFQAVLAAMGVAV